MNTSLTCVWIALLMWQPVIAVVSHANFHILHKATRPSNGRSISTYARGAVQMCESICLNDPNCTSFTLRKGTSCQKTCELRDQSGVTETLLEDDSTANYYTKRECGSSPCLSGVLCVEGLDGHTCECAAGFTGSNCETDINECSSDPCQNSATCSDGVNEYTCTCAAGYTGTTCALDVIECSSDPCRNSATCSDGVNGYTCTCAAGYIGTTCALDVDECASNPCHNGATCTDMVNGYTCTCDVCYNGANCGVVAILCDCSAIQAAAPGYTSGVYNVAPIGGTPIDVYCDMDTDGGGWLVFQERHNGAVDFYLNWESYAAGFGDPDGEFWLGNRNLHLLTQQKTYTLRVNLGDWEGNQANAQYSSFTIDSEQDKFRLTLGAYSGDAGNELSYNSGAQFSATDEDNDGASGAHCAQRFRGAWWYDLCSHANLNGHYYPSGPYTAEQTSSNYPGGVTWHQWKGYWYSLKTTRMMVRPAP